jgi:dipeptidyl aminopeptidase/acylaminoacyl peptidase
LALSPDGRRVVTALSVRTIPKEWEEMYPSPVPSSPYRITIRKQKPAGFSGQRDISEYVIVDLASGKVNSIVHAPIGNGLGWWGFSHAEWSADGKLVVLSDVFLPSTKQDPNPRKNGPCVVISDLTLAKSECLMNWADRTVFSGTGKGLQVHGASFDHGDRRTIRVLYQNSDGSDASKIFVERSDGAWIAGPTARPSNLNRSSDVMEISVKQSINDPPVLTATNVRTKTSRVVWDPNRCIRAKQLGKVSVLHWKDESGREWIGGLYQPPDYVPGRRYPLIIQTHGFDEHRFAPSGSFQRLLLHRNLQQRASWYSRYETAPFAPHLKKLRAN